MAEVKPAEDTAIAALTRRRRRKTSAVTTFIPVSCSGLSTSCLRKGEPGYETWGKGSAEYVGNMAAWGSLTADEQLGYVYIPLSAPTASYSEVIGPARISMPTHLCAWTPRPAIWCGIIELIHHDIWEYDAATPPILGDITVDGKQIKAVIASNKTGFLYVFDRVTGKPVWPIEERPVPTSTDSRRGGLSDPTLPD